MKGKNIPSSAMQCFKSCHRFYHDELYKNFLQTNADRYSRLANFLSKVIELDELVSEYFK